MGLTTTILRSRAVAALTSPQGVDRYLEQVNPMWAAHEVRARIVDVHREVDVPGHPPVATITLQPTVDLAGPPRRPARPARRRDRRRPPYDAGLHDLQPRLAATATGSRSPCAPTRTASSRSYLVERADARARWSTSRQAQGEFVLPDQVPEHVLFISGGSGITPVMSMLRSLQRRTHRGRVTFLHYAQSPEHQIFAAELDDDPPLRPRHRRAPAAPRARRPEPVAGVPRAAACRATATCPTWACGPAPMIEAVQAAYDGSDGAPRRVLPAAAHRPARPPRATSPSPGPARRRRTPARRSWSRPRRSG